MQRNLSKILLFLLVAVFCLAGSDRMSAQESPNLLKAKKEAEAKGFTFVASRDEIIAQAKKEGRLRVLFSLTRSHTPISARRSSRNIRLLISTWKRSRVPMPPSVSSWSCRRV